MQKLKYGFAHGLIASVIGGIVYRSWDVPGLLKFEGFLLCVGGAIFACMWAGITIVECWSKK